MDRYVLVVTFCQRDDGQLKDCLEPVKHIYDRLFDISTQETTKGSSPLPACSQNGSPAAQRWYFALQACQGQFQFCSPDWEELGTKILSHDNEEEQPNTLELFLSSLSNAADQDAEQPSQAELLGEAAEGLHSLSDKLPPPGKALLDVLVLGSVKEPPPVKDLLLMLGALEHMSCWHSAKINVVTQNPARWKKVALYLNASVTEVAGLDDCVDHEEVWRGALVIREKKFVSELRFDGFSLHRLLPLNSSFLQSDTAASSSANQGCLSEVFHYYASALELVQLVSLTDLPGFLLSDTHFQLGLTGESVKAKLLLDQLRSLRGKTAALFSLSCSVTPVAQPAASQLTSQRWRESITRRQRSLPVPDVEVKGENAHYFLLVQGSQDAASRACRVRLLHTDGQINGAATMATVSNLLRVKAPASGGAARRILDPLRCLQGDELLNRERKLRQVQKLVLQQYLREKEETSSSFAVPILELQAIVNTARKQYLEMIDSTQPSVASCLTDQLGETTSDTSGCATGCLLQSDWPESSVLPNVEKLQRRRQKRRFGLLGPGSSDNLLGPKDSHQKVSPALLDARELLKHFTSEGQPAGELQPLAVSRGVNVFQLSGDFSPGKLSRMCFRTASSSCYHGLEFCLDQQRSLDRDQALVRLQSRLLRCETQTTCSREPSALTFALSPAPSPAVTSEPGSVPDGETLLLHNADVARLKRHSWDKEAQGGPAHKRLVKSESSDSLCSQSSSSSGSGPQRAGRTLRQQNTRSCSTSTCVAPATAPASKQTSADLATTGNLKPQQQNTHSGPAEENTAKESRSQKHNRMLSEVVAKTLKHHGIGAEHGCFQACSKRLFDISKFYLKDLKTSRGLYEEMKKAAGNNARQVVDWVLEKSSKM